MIKVELLRQQILLEDLDGEGLKKISKIMKKLSLKKGDQLFKEKDDTKGLWLIHSGKIEISRVTADGWRQTLAVLTPGTSSENCPLSKIDGTSHPLRRLKTQSSFSFQKKTSKTCSTRIWRWRAVSLRESL